MSVQMKSQSDIQKRKNGRYVDTLNGHFFIFTFLYSDIRVPLYPHNPILYFHIIFLESSILMFNLLNVRHELTNDLSRVKLPNSTLIKTV